MKSICIFLKSCFSATILFYLLSLSSICHAKIDQQIFKEHNFKFKDPGNLYNKVKPSYISKDSILAYKLSYSEIYFSIIAENINPHIEYSSKKYSEFCVSKIKESASNFKTIEILPYKLNGLNGYLAEVEYDYNGSKERQILWTYYKNGYLYQLIIYGNISYREVIKKHAEKLFNNFSVLDINKQSPVEESLLFKSFRSSEYGYSIDLSKDNWLKWSMLSEKYPNADFGVHKNEKAGYLIYALPIAKENQHVDAITTTLVRIAGVEYPNQYITNFKEFDNTDSSGYIFDYIPASNMDEYNYRFKIISSKEAAYMLMILHKKDPKNSDHFDASYDNAFKNFKIIGSPAAKGSLHESKRIQQANINNSLGLFYYNNKNYEKSIIFFKEALSLSNHKPAYLLNCISGLTKLKKYDESLTVLKKYGNEFSQNNDILAWHAWILYQKDMYVESKEKYESLFSNDYRNDDDFSIYISLLQKLNDKEGMDEAFTKYLNNGDSFAIRKLKARKLYDFGEYKKALEILDSLQKGKPFISEIAYEQANNHFKLENYNKSIEICQKLIDKGFASATAYYIKGESEYALKWYKDAKKSFEKALDFAPMNNNIKDYILHISGIIGEGDNSSVRKEITPIKLPESLKTKLSTYEEDKDFDSESGSEYIYRITGFEYKKGDFLKRTVYRKVKILNDSDISKFSTIEMVFNPLYEDIYVNDIVVKNGENEILSKVSRSSFYVTDNKSNSMATYEKVLNVPIPNLEKGNIIEFAHTIKSNAVREDFGFERIFLFATSPVKLNALFLKAPEEEVVYKEQNLSPPEKSDGAIIWTKENTEAFQWEPYQIEMENFSPYVLISSKERSWQEVAKEHLTKIKEKLTIDSQIKDLANDLTKGVETDIEKVKILSDYVQKNITYKPIEFGSRGQIPNTAKETITNKYGDCKDHSVLLFALLKSIGIDSQLVLVNSIYKVDETLPSLDQFNHVINYIPKLDAYIDTTEKGLTAVDLVPSGLSEKNVLIVDTKDPKIKRTPRYTDGGSKLTTNKEINIINKYSANVKEQVELSGYAASYMRSHIKRIERSGYTEWGQQLINSYLPGAKLTDIDIKNIFDNRKNLTITMSYDLSNHSNFIGSHLVAQIPMAWERYYLSVSPVHNRKTDFRIYYPFELESKNNFILPSDYKLTKTDTNDEIIENKFNSLKIDISQEKNKVKQTFSYKVIPGEYKKSEYAEFFEKTSDLIIKASNNIYYDKK